MSIATREAPASAELPPRFLGEADWQLIVSSLRLCKRESEIVSAMIGGASEIQIAAELGISTHTVHTYTDRLYRRLGVRSRCAVVARVFEAYVRTTRGSHDDNL
jgi:DNA-binding NarL/FixJ family response regulator